MIKLSRHDDIDIKYIAIFDRLYQMVGKNKVSPMGARGWGNQQVLYYSDFNDNDICLEIGCGYSYFILILSLFAKKVYGIDSFSWEFEKERTLWYKDIENFEFGDVGIIVGNASKLPFPDNYFDKIYTISALEHFQEDDIEKCCREVYRTLKPGGVFTGTVDYNPISEYPMGKESGLCAFTYESFLSRIVNPSGCNLAGEDYLKHDQIPNNVDYIAETLFFKLAKGQK